MTYVWRALYWLCAILALPFIPFAFAAAECAKRADAGFIRRMPREETAARR